MLGERQVVTGHGVLAHDALRIVAFGYVFVVCGLHFVAQGGVYREAAAVVLIGPPEISGGAYIDESDLERFLCLCDNGRHRGERRGDDQKSEDQLLHRLLLALPECCVLCV